MTTITIALNERGNRVGDSHHNAKLTNNEVDQLIAMHEAGGIGYRRLAKIWEVSPATARNLIKGRRRAQTPASYKAVYVID